MIASHDASNSCVRRPSSTAKPVTSVESIRGSWRPWVGNQSSQSAKTSLSRIARKKTGMVTPRSEPETTNVSRNRPW